MGLTFVDIEVSNLADKNRKVHNNFLVDSGATYTLLPEKLWKAIGVVPEDNITVTFADGRQEKRDTGFAFVSFNGKRTPTRVILGEKDDCSLLGVVTLEEMGYLLDPLKRVLLDAKIMI